MTQDGAMPRRNGGSSRAGVAIAIALGVVALILAAFTLGYVYFVNPGQPKPIPSSTAYSQTVAATRGDPSTGYWGTANFTLAGPGDALFAVSVFAVPGENGCGTYPVNLCVVYLMHPTSNMTSSAIYTGLELNASVGGPFTIESAIPAGPVEIFTASVPIGFGSSFAQAYSVTVTIQVHGQILVK